MVRWGKRSFGRGVLAVLIATSCFLAAARLAAQAASPEPDQAAQGYPVNVDGREILRIFENVGSFSAQERAQAVANRLQALVNDPTIDLDQIAVVDSPFGTSIELRDNVLLVVTDNDARHLQVSRSVVAS
jgi:hypothetical protein